MSLEQPAASSHLIDRIKNILLQPATEWDRIAGEPANLKKLYVAYALPLIVIAALCGLIGGVVFGYGALGIHVRIPLMSAVVTALIQIIGGLAMLYVMGLVIKALAPTFASLPDQSQAHKLAVYSATAAYLSGVFGLFPPLAVLGILGLYSLVLLYLGLPRLMKTPEDKRIGYFLVIVVVMIVLGVVTFTILGVVTNSLRGAGAGPHFGASRSDQVEGTITLPGGGTVDIGEAQRELERAKAAYEGGATAVIVDPAQLQMVLPGSLPGGFSRTSVSHAANAAMGMNLAQAEGLYEREGGRITLTIMHSGAVGGLAAMAGAMGVSESREDDNGYQRTNTRDGRVVTEALDRAARTASYQIVARNGVIVTAEGSGVSDSDVRAAVEAVGIARVEAIGE